MNLPNFSHLKELTLKDIFANEYVIFMVHVLLVTGVFLNISQLYRQYNIVKEFDKEKTVLSILTQDRKDLEDRKNYFGSELYKEKFGKEVGYKSKGEQVIDTSQIEKSTSNEPTNYIPDESKVYKSNWEKWWDVFFITPQDALDSKPK
jgi:hypothetical protein